MIKAEEIAFGLSLVHYIFRACKKRHPPPSSQCFALKLNVDILLKSPKPDSRGVVLFKIACLQKGKGFYFGTTLKRWEKASLAGWQLSTSWLNHFCASLVLVLRKASDSQRFYLEDQELFKWPFQAWFCFECMTWRLGWQQDCLSKSGLQQM